MNHAVTSMEDLAAALHELAESQPAGDSAQTVGAMILVGPEDSQTITLKPRYIAWLTDLISDELLTCRESRGGGTGECGHCGHVPQPGDITQTRSPGMAR